MVTKKMANKAEHGVKRPATGEERKTALPNWQEKAITPHRLPRRDYSINGQRWQVQSWNSKFNDGPCRPSEMWLDVSHQFWCAEFGLERWQLKLYSASIGWSNLAVSAAVDSTNWQRVTKGCDGISSQGLIVGQHSWLESYYPWKGFIYQNKTMASWI